MRTPARDETCFYLASASPRRVQLLHMLGFPFQQIIADCDENDVSTSDPEQVTIELSLRKVNSVLPHLRAGVVIAADTIVVLDGLIMGKPHDDRMAIDFLTRLSGRTHLVYTGVTVCRVETARMLSAACMTRVTFRTLSEDNIRTYVATGETTDKAGAYAIQGKGVLLIEKIDGCFTNVIGLPLETLDTLLTSFGHPLFDYISDIKDVPRLRATP